jgi:hypothetical protein
MRCHGCGAREAPFKDTRTGFHFCWNCIVELVSWEYDYCPEAEGMEDWLPAEYRPTPYSDEPPVDPEETARPVEQEVAQ